MLFFIMPLSKCAMEKSHLNTSHVILYPPVGCFVSFLHLYLNTSHVILYLTVEVCLQDLCLFKYISCYSLSDKTRIER